MKQADASCQLACQTVCECVRQVGFGASLRQDRASPWTATMPNALIANCGGSLLGGKAVDEGSTTAY